MTFLHAAFLGGSLAVAVPIVLHLIMRQQPKQLEFPAMRFLERRQTANRRQLRFRHWLLLALRSAMILLLSLALARPSIVASGVLGDQEAPAAAALVFDAHPRMLYTQQNQTRLAAAQDIALWLLPQLPPESEVAVVDSQSTGPAFSVDLGAARQRIERLAAGGASRPLATAIEAALQLVHQSDKPRREVYVFTDLASEAWTGDAASLLASQLPQYSGVALYVVDVGVKQPSNLGLGPLELSGEVLSQDSTLRIGTHLVRTGDAQPRGVELYLVEGGSQSANKRGQRMPEPAEGAPPRIEFSLRGLGPGIHQGYVKLAGEDALACDDVRWFTVQVRPGWKVLVVTPADASRAPADYALFLSEAIAPAALRAKGEAAFECSVIDSARLADHPLKDVAAVCLIDPQPLPDAAWQKLHAFVVAGGGLGVFLGGNAVPLDAFNSPAAADLLPGKLLRQWRAGESYLAPASFGHPLLARFRRLAGQIAWETLPVFRHWQFAELAAESAVVLRYANGQPALVERPVGQGRVLALTTPVSDPASRRDAWNLLPTGDQPWPFVMLANEMMYYLVGSGEQRLNYITGETAVIRADAPEQFPVYVLTTPNGDQIRTPLDERQRSLVVASTDVPGNYRLEAGGAAGGAQLGFSADYPAGVSQLERATPEHLRAVFGETPYQLAASRDEIDRDLSVARVGRELFPYLILLLALVLGCEQVLSNRFYQDYDTAPATSRASAWAAGKLSAQRPQSPAASRT